MQILKSEIIESLFSDDFIGMISMFAVLKFYGVFVPVVAVSQYQHFLNCAKLSCITYPYLEVQRPV